MAKTAQGLAEYARAQIGKPYWWGTYGQIANAAVFSAKRAQYPNEYTAGDFQSQYGQKVHDCVGLIKGYLWCDAPTSAPKYNMNQDVAVGGLYANCNEHGPIATMPDVPGVCVFMANMGHVGVYVGNGEVVEAMGHAYGVVKTKLNGRGWAYWGKPKWISYGADSKAPAAEGKTDDTPMCVVELPEVRMGSESYAVSTLQLLLNSAGFGCGEVDGEFGTLTHNAVLKFQRARGLDDDGIVGKMTWGRLLRG